MSMNRIYIGKLSGRAEERDVEDFLRGFGKVRDIRLKDGYGFVEFEDYRDAEDAVHELDGKELMGERVIIELARGGRGRGGSGSRGGGSYRGSFRGGDYRDGGRGGSRGGRGGRGGLDKYGPPTRTKYRVVVENLSSRVSWQDLKDFVRQAGQVTYADAHKWKVGEGVVEFSSYDDMKNAIDKLDDTDLGGKRIRLIEDKGSGAGTSAGRSRSRSPRRSRSRSYSRSKSRSKSPQRYCSRSRSNSRSRSVSPRS